MPSRNPPTPHRAPAPAPHVEPPAGQARPCPGIEDVQRVRVRVDDRLVRPETRQEMLDGQLLLAPPAGPPHGDAHFQLDGEALFHLRQGYVGSTDMLTRMDQGSDFATDTSIRKEGLDPATGDRYLEEVVFEVVHEQSRRDITRRAERLTARGIRRVFAVFVKDGEVAEWSPAERDWRVLPPEAAIDDACLIRPLPVRALLDRAEGRNAVARVLLEENNPVLEQAQQAAQQEAFRDGLVEGRRDGLAEGRREAIERLCQVLGIELTGARRATLAHLGADGLEALADRIAHERCWTC